MTTYTNKSRGTPKMQRAHFEFLAAAIKYRASITPRDANVMQGFARDLAEGLATTNPAFRRSDFFLACGLTVGGFHPENP